MTTIAESLAQAIELHKRGELARAEPIYRQILAREPAHAEALHLLGLVTLHTARVDEALVLLEQSLAADPHNVERLGHLGAAYGTAGRHADAALMFDRAIERESNSATLLYNRGRALQELERFDAAAADYRRCLELDGRHVLALNNLAVVHRELGKPVEAVAHADAALAIAPEFAMAHYNRSLALLSLGRLAEGFAEYEWRLRVAELKPRNYPQPTWDGSPLAGRTLLVHCEQGFGDTLQFIRYLKQIGSAAGGNVVIAAPRALVPLLAQSGFRGLVPREGPLGAFDVHAPLLSLPHILGTELGTVPREVPYLAAPPARVAHWRGELARFDGLKVGIACQGRKEFPADRSRSIPLEQFAALAEIPSVRLVSLQRKPSLAELAGGSVPFEVIDFGDVLDDPPFLELAAVIKNLDLVVSADTAIAHLAGALGARVWLALAFAADWRWMLERSDSPWYPTMRLFRQRSRGDWAGVFDDLARELARLRPMG